MKKNVNKNKYNVLSLFSSAGIGELGIESSGMTILLSNELNEKRCKLYKENYSSTKNICGDIWKVKDEICKEWVLKSKSSPFLVYATPPCQGMSFNSVGKRQQEILKGKRPKDDPRNQLIIPTMEIIKKLKPIWVLFENVEGMQHTLIPVNNKYINIIDYIKQQLGDEYTGGPEVVNCADYGIPQTRVRLITVFTRDNKGKNYYRQNNTFLPKRTHTSEINNKKLKKWVTLRDVIGKLPKLSAEKNKNVCNSIPWHVVPILNDEKLWWIKNTPPNETAFNNQCVKCGYNGNTRHGMCFINGIHVSKKDTPIYCSKCGALLPRPTMIDKNTGKRRLIKGFDSAYKRMSWDTPAPTITQNVQTITSDKKIHPDQNRTLSVYEAMCLQTITKYKYKFQVDGKQITTKMCCEIIGESVPPFLIELICKNIIKIDNNEKTESKKK